MRTSALLLVLLVLSSARAQADANCRGEAPADAQAQAQYLPGRGELLLWRSWELAGESCVQVDWPRPERLSPSATRALAAELRADEARRRAEVRASLPEAEVELRTSVFATALWPPGQVPAPGERPSLPLCPRVPDRAAMPTLELPDALAATVLRVRPHRCEPGSRPLAGSGVLLAPALGLTAAHVVMSPTGMVCRRYRVAPGGRRFSDPPAAPYGQSFVSRARPSGRGGWHEEGAAASASFPARTRHDHAWLLLDDPAQLPPGTAWPRLRFGAPAATPGTPMLSAGYPAQTPRARTAPGAMVAMWGQAGCLRGDEGGARRHALWLAPGGSGGPIWTWSGERPLELHSLGSRVEGLPGERYETLGPALDLEDYWRLLGVLADDRDWRIARAAERRRRAQAFAQVPSAPPPVAARERNCELAAARPAWGSPGLASCRVRCSARPHTCRGEE